MASQDSYANSPNTAAASPYAFDPNAAVVLADDPDATVEQLRQAVRDLAARHWKADYLGDVIPQDAANASGIYGEALDRFIPTIREACWELSAHCERTFKQVKRVGWFGQVFMDPAKPSWP